MTTYIHLAIATIITAFLTFLINKLLKRKNPIRISYLLSTTGKISLPNSTPSFALINTHTIIVCNPYNRLVKDIRIQNYLPQELLNDGFKSISEIITIFPSTEYEIKKIDDSTVEEIIFSKLIPKESITITYMYKPTVYFHQFNISVKSDDGFAKPTKYAPQILYPNWLNILLLILIMVGSVTVINLILNFIHIFYALSEITYFI